MAWFRRGGARQRARGAGAFALAGAVAAGVAGCEPSSVEDAEARGKVAWLARQNSVAAVAALGRLADSDERAVEVLEERAEAGSTSTFVAAWEATRRGAAWGPPMLKEALGREAVAEKAALAMGRGDAKLALFLPELEAALVALEEKGHRGLPVATLLASAGDAAEASVRARLGDGRTRGAMCQALQAPEASPAAHRALYAVTPSARDHAACMEVVLRRAEVDEAALQWLGAEAEPGLVGEASESPRVACDKLRALWAVAFARRSALDAAGLEVPLAAALRRCPRELDGEVSRCLRKQMAWRETILGALDPRGPLASTVPLTCVEVANVSKGDTPRAQERAEELTRGGCRRGGYAPR